MFEIRTYQTADGSRPYDEWLDGISPAFAARIRKGVSRMEAGNFGDSWRLNSDVPIFERRFDFGPGFRAYYGRDGEAVVLLLCGGRQVVAEAGHRKGVRILEGLHGEKG